MTPRGTRPPRPAAPAGRRGVLLVAAVGAILLGAAPPPLGSRLRTAPLRPPLVLNGGYGDYRGGHFHAGLDLGTARRVGRAVRAPVSGWVERVRSSGVGYGRALYLRARDGRTLEFGHLDAFAGPPAAFVEAAQESTGRYEQDLWPDRGRFPVRAGAIVAWTGESGAGGPHLHFEIRRGDVAYNPLRAGLALADRAAPVLADLTLEPLDDSSRVEGRWSPFTVSLARSDTVRAIGRLRAVVRASDAMSRGGVRTVPWRVGIEWEGRRVECRFDSISWATDMVDADYVYDAGRVTGRRGLVLWSRAGYRPRVLVAGAPPAEEAGTIEIRPGDPPRALQVWARDLAGHAAARRVVLHAEARPPRAGAGWWRGDTWWSDAAAEFASLPGGFLRVGLRDPAAKRGLDLQLGAVARAATEAAGLWSATFAVPKEATERTVRLVLAARATGGAGTGAGRGGYVFARRAAAADTFTIADATGAFRVDFAARSLFEDATVLGYPAPAPPSQGLEPQGGAWQVEPSELPLRRAARIAIALPAGPPLDRVGLYRLERGAWHWVGGRYDAAGRTVSGESRRLGRFALLRDLTLPNAKIVRTAPPPAKRGPYSRWAVEATASDAGSGIDPAESYLEIDGRRVPTEWDPEAGRLRWRPLRPPGKGIHEVRVTAADRAGNTIRETGTFTIGP